MRFRSPTHRITKHKRKTQYFGVKEDLKMKIIEVASRGLWLIVFMWFLAKSSVNLNMLPNECDRLWAHSCGYITVAKHDHFWTIVRRLEVLVLPLAWCQLWCYNEVFEEDSGPGAKNHWTGFEGILIYRFGAIFSAIGWALPLGSLIEHYNHLQPAFICRLSAAYPHTPW